MYKYRDTVFSELKKFIISDICLIILEYTGLEKK